MGDENTKRMLGLEGWKPTAAEAMSAGLVQWVVPKEQLQEEAQKIAKGWVDDGTSRSFMAGSHLKELELANARESIELADAFLGSSFLREQGRFLWSKKKRVPSLVFLSLWALRPLWSRFI